MKRIFILLFILLSSLNLYALEAVDISSNSAVSILEHSDIYSSKKDEPLGKINFKPYKKKIVNSANFKGIIWIKIKLFNGSSKSIKRALVLNSSSLEFITLYDKNGNILAKDGYGRLKKHNTLY